MRFECRVATLTHADMYLSLSIVFFLDCCRQRRVRVDGQIGVTMLKTRLGTGPAHLQGWHRQLTTDTQWIIPTPLSVLLYLGVGWHLQR